MLFYVAFSENFEEHVAQHQGLMTTYLNAIVNTLQGRKISAILEKLHFSKSVLYENFQFTFSELRLLRRDFPQCLLKIRDL